MSRYDQLLMNCTSVSLDPPVDLKALYILLHKASGLWLFGDILLKVMINSEACFYQFYKNEREVFQSSQIHWQDLLTSSF